MEMNNNNNSKDKKRRKTKKNDQNINIRTNNNNNTKSKNPNQPQNNNPGHGTIQKKSRNRKNQRGLCGKLCNFIVWCTVGLVCFYVVLPCLFWYFPEMSSFLIFSNRFRWPPIGKLDKPSDFGLNHTRNLYLNPRKNIQIGVWHVLPQVLADSKPDYEESLLKTKLPVVLYMHGNSGTRAGSHRIQMYKMFSALNFHTIAFDYRGYAESTGVPTEDGIVDDSHYLFHWIKQKTAKDTPIILWGHSLGTGVATKLAKILCDADMPPTSLILEAPFTNIVNATYHHPFLIPFKYFKKLKSKLANFVQRSGVEFANDESISSVKSPIMILHAEDDFLIPIELGKKLYDIGVETRPAESGPIKFVTFKKSDGYGHKHIHKSPELPEIVSSFVQTSRESGF